MNTDCEFYLCGMCFEVSEVPQNCHGQAMIHVDTCRQQAQRRRPRRNRAGELTSRAPEWYLEARYGYNGAYQEPYRKNLRI